VLRIGEVWFGALWICFDGGMSSCVMNAVTDLNCFCSSTASNTVFRYVVPFPLINSLPPLTRFYEKPDGYLTEERKQADPDHGFSTFFSETGTRILQIPTGLPLEVY
jgi:hypothetical protein